MVYFENSGDGPDRPPRRRGSAPDPGLDDAKVRYILEVAAEHPRFTPEEVYATIYYDRGRHDITKAMVRQTLDGRRRTFAWRGFRR
ncbi:hypothetical protein [Amycolatopsis sp. NPDC021455]|uniref:hypothetical protein n=1 Tax=Amycolatopsis sp. NPDC021455 TaxID=3154901 RepID=UPI0033DBAB50